MPELTLAEFVPLYLERHAASVRHAHDRARCGERLRYATARSATCRCATWSG